MNEDLMAALHPPRLPEAFTQITLADILAAFGLGLGAALLVLLLVGPLLRRRPRALGPAQRLRAAQNLPRAARITALGDLLADLAVPLPPEESASLYRKDAAADQILHHHLTQVLAKSRKKAGGGS